MFQQQDSGGEHGSKSDTHGCPRFDPAKAADELDHADSCNRRASRTDQHRPAGDCSGYKECDHNARQNHMADGVTDQGLTPQHQKVAGQSTGHSRKTADQQRDQREGDKISATHAGTPCGGAMRASISSI